MLDVNMEDLRAYLIEVAKNEDTVTYGEVAHHFGKTIKGNHDITLWSALLEEISHTENAEGRPLLSALVVRADDGLPGGGFYPMARAAGRYGGLTPKDKVEFAVNEIKRLHEYWTQQD